MFYAVDAETGAVVWSHDTALDGARGQFHGDSLVTEDAVVVGAHGPRGGYLYAFERGSGRVRWKVGFPRGVMTQVFRYGETALAVAQSGEVVAVDLITGKLRWHRDLSGAIRTTYSGDPALEDGRLYVPWGSGVVDALDAATGDHLWRQEVSAVLNTSAAVFAGEVVVGTLDGSLLRFDAKSGEPLGAFDLPSPGGVLLGDLVRAGDCLLALGAGAKLGDPPVMAGPFSLACLDPSSGEVRWERHWDAEWSTLRPLVWKRQVLVGRKGLLLALDLGDGSVVWKQPLDGTPRGLSASSETLYVGTREGMLEALPWPPPPRPATDGSAAPRRPRAGVGEDLASLAVAFTQ